MTRYIAATTALVLLSSRTGLAQPLIQVTGLTPEGAPEGLLTLQLLLLLTVLTLAPSLLILTTCFTRVITVLAFVRNSLATQNMPPNQVLIGIALFITFFVMAPVWTQVNQQAVQPYVRGELSQAEAVRAGMVPIREFMLRQTREKDLALFAGFAGIEQVSDTSEIPDHVIIPAFAISELKTAFQMGFMVFLPFLVLDMVVASTLMSMGMLMLPPMMISLPFKILLFVAVDGWYLVVKSLLLSFR